MFNSSVYIVMQLWMILFSLVIFEDFAVENTFLRRRFLWEHCYCRLRIPTYFHTHLHLDFGKIFLETAYPLRREHSRSFSLLPMVNGLLEEQEISKDVYILSLMRFLTEQRTKWSQAHTYLSSVTISNQWIDDES